MCFYFYYNKKTHHINIFFKKCCGISKKTHQKNTPPPKKTHQTHHNTPAPPQALGGAECPNTNDSWSNFIKKTHQTHQTRKKLFLNFLLCFIIILSMLILINVYVVKRALPLALCLTHQELVPGPTIARRECIKSDSLIGLCYNSIHLQSSDLSRARQVLSALLTDLCNIYYKTYLQHYYNKKR